MEIIQILLSLFFTYFVLMMSDVQLLLNCSLQRFLKENILVKHFIIFFSIFIFTFVLGWYRFDALKVENFDNVNTTKKKLFLNKNILFNYFKSTLIIYIIFIISTKNEGLYMLIFLISILFLTLLQVYIKSINKDIHKKIYKYYFINQTIKNNLVKTIEKDDINDFNKIIFYHNFTFICFILLLILLLSGMYNYYIKKKNTYKKDFKFYKFLFGNNYCKGINY